MPASFKLQVFAVVAAAFLSGCSPKSSEQAGTPAREKEKAPQSRVSRSPEGEAVITLDAATQKTMGLETAMLSAAQLGPEVKASGRVLDVSSLASQVTDLTAAQATRHASQSELQRLKTLAGQNNASQRALQAAEAAAARDESQAESARLRLEGSWGSALAGLDELRMLVQSLVSLSNALVQLNIAAGETLPAVPTGGQILPLGTDSTPVGAKFLGPAPQIDPQMQGPGYLFLVSPNSSRLTPGAAVAGYILLPGEPQSGVALPREAVVRYNGTAWVYRQTSEQTFVRTEVALQRPLTDGWFVRKGVKVQDKVATTGAQLLLSEELKGGGVD
jgi:hypothetical protein